MKKLNKIIQITILLLLMVNTVNVQAQNAQVEQSFLLNKKWLMYEKTDHKVICEYSQKIIKHHVDSLFIGNEYYYLSDNIDTIFDMSKVGKYKKGKYIISKVVTAKNDNLVVLEVIKAEGNELILRNIKQTWLLKYKVY